MFRILRSRSANLLLRPHRPAQVHQIYTWSATGMLLLKSESETTLRRHRSERNELCCHSSSIVISCTYGNIRSYTIPPATTGTYAEPSQPPILNPNSKNACKSFSRLHSSFIAFVKALPDIWPAFRMLAISESDLKTRSSFIIGLSDFRELDLRSFAIESLLDVVLNKKREIEAEVVGFAAKSVKISEAPLTIGGNRSTIVPTSPVY